MYTDRQVAQQTQETSDFVSYQKGNLRMTASFQLAALKPQNNIQLGRNVMLCLLNMELVCRLTET